MKDITNKEYFARGMTGLLDAVGKTINHVGKVNLMTYAMKSLQT